MLLSLAVTLPRSLAAILLAGFLFPHVILSEDPQTPLEVEELRAPLPPKRVAVIGAGAAGASAAYYLRTYSSFFSVPINITVFEQSSNVGGRSTTVDVFNDPSLPIELGASIFVDVNRNLMKAAKKFGLKIVRAGEGQPRESTHSLGVWDGKEFVFKQRENSFRWWNISKLLLRYGWAPMRTQSLMKSTINNFLKLYRWPYFPWKSLSSVAISSGLIEATWATGAEYLRENHISEPFSREIIQASTRVNYGQNLPLIHGLETMVCMATDGAVSIEGGNWQIFRGMIDSSEAKLKLNHRVTKVNRQDDETYLVSYNGPNNHTDEEQFDQVVIANPLQFSGIKIKPSISNHPDAIPYVELHVTVFATTHKLSPKYFKLPLKSSVPEVVLTTLPEGVDLGARRDGVGPAGFWSISTLMKARPAVAYKGGSIADDQYVYKIFSPKPLSAAFLADILDLDELQMLQTSDNNYNNNTGEYAHTYRTIHDIPKSDISWYYEKVWNSYPYMYPRVTFEDVKLGPNLWYTNGIESFISTMETSSLAGMNVAALILSQWISKFDSKLKMYEDNMSP
ncbi:hypothetical protein FQN57_004933 [Myotisia sp. PD_48]|nr:hypothetical protein FQN57_004933 [Myotisia sp. PD_48]